MRAIDKELIKEDLQFIDEYLELLVERHPDLRKEEYEILSRIIRRMKDIDRRIDAN